MLSELQRRKISRMFDVLDLNGDGFLSPEDTDRVVRRLAEQRGWPEGGPEHRALREAYEPAVRALNPYRDADGRVDSEGYTRYHEDLLSVPGAYDETLRQVATLVFATLDADRDGRVSESELARFYDAYSIEPGLAPDAFRRLDADGDGTVSQAEVLEAVREFYCSSDPEAPGNWLLGTF